MTTYRPDEIPTAAQRFSHVDIWVFDLDNTLYPPSADLWPQVQALITAYVIDVTGLGEADATALQKRYRDEYGTTFKGLMARHDIDPDHFLKTVHAIDYSPVLANPALVGAIRNLPGDKFILTNGDVAHARNVLARLGDDDLFPHIFDIRAMGFVPKPHRDAYDAFLKAHAVDPRRAAMFEDLEHNLRVPFELGMKTVHIADASSNGNTRPRFVDYRTNDLSAFLLALP